MVSLLLENRNKTDNAVEELKSCEKGSRKDRKKLSNKQKAVIICIIIVILSIVIYIPIRNNTSKEYNEKIQMFTKLNKDNTTKKNADIKVVISAMDLLNMGGATDVDVFVDGKYIDSTFNSNKLYSDYYNVKVSRNFFTGKIDKIIIDSKD